MSGAEQSKEPDFYTDDNLSLQEVIHAKAHEALMAYERHDFSAFTRHLEDWRKLHALQI